MIAKSQKYWSGDASELLRVGEGFVLADVDADSTPGYEKGKTEAAEDLAAGAQELDEYQERLFAQSRVAPEGARVSKPGVWGGAPLGAASVLLVLQAMDSAGKGG